MTKKTRDQDIAFIQALADLLKKNDLTELEVLREYGEDDTLNIRVSQIKNVAPQPIAAPLTDVPTPQSAPLLYRVLRRQVIRVKIRRPTRAQ